MTWRRFTALVAGLSSESRFLRAWADERKRDAPLAGRDVDGPDALQGLI